MSQICRKREAEMEMASLMVPLETYNRVVTKYNDLAKGYRKLRDEHAKCEAWMAEFHEQYKAMKECVRQWQAYHDKLKSRSAAAKLPWSPPKDVPEQRSSLRVTSSQTTEADEEPSPPTVHEAASDDEPEFVSTRSLKRKREVSPPGKHASVHIKQEEANSPQNPINLMSEDYSSPEIKRMRPVRAETSDLDAYVRYVDTPRKRRRDRGVSEEVSRPVSLPVNTSSLSEGNLKNEEQNRNLGVLDASAHAHKDPSLKARDFAVATGTNLGNSNALRPRSANIPGPSRTSSIRNIANAKRKREDPRKIASLSEDGEDDSIAPTAHLPQQAPHDEAKRRLGSLLEESALDRQPLSTRKPAAASTPRSREARQLLKPSSDREALVHQPLVPYKTPLGLEPPPRDADPEEEPLRCRPWQSLRLEDFKVNPKFMGTDYAFSETFRSREQRRCLPGCTKPECCGNAFRKALEMGVAKTNKTDEEVLEEFLGRNYHHIMVVYDKDKRKDILIQAHAQALANQYGKHRNAYERPRTPPGFWRTDMPSTQEAEEDRARAHEIHLQKVEERWREAMRDGGRWLFRDE